MPVNRGKGRACSERCRNPRGPRLAPTGVESAFGTSGGPGYERVPNAMTRKTWCPNCGLSESGRYCPRCGDTLPRPAGRENWLIGGVAWGVVMLFLLAPVIRQESPGAGGSGVRGLAGPAGPVAEVSRSRSAADQLFDHVVEAAEAGDSAGLALYLPMAIQAYQEARPLDADGLFHLSTLQRTSDLVRDAGGTAGEVLAGNPNHLLGLYAAAEAAEQAGDTVAARDFYARLVDAWDGEMERDRPEYHAHAEMLEAVRARAAALLGAG